MKLGNCLGMHPLVDALADQIRTRRNGLPDLQELEADPKFELINGTLDGEDLFIGNELHVCRGFRKLHLEIARLGLGLQILHCVWFPDPCFDLPLFGVDIVASAAGVSAAIVDISPVRGILPKNIDIELQNITFPKFSKVRELPSWGSIFSPYVLFIRPDGYKEEQLFLNHVDKYLSILEKSTLNSIPESLNEFLTKTRHEGQLNYCMQQKRNDKTRRVLEKAFNPKWAETYINNLLFQNPPPLI